jgi:diguanylate cyclase (GGDEF)-like protein
MPPLKPLQSTLSRIQSGQATEDELEQLRAFIHLASQALDDARVRERFHISTHDIIKLLDIAVEISACVDAGQLAQLVADQLVDLLGAEACVVSRFEAQGKALSIWVDHLPRDWGGPEDWYRPLELDDYPWVRRALDQNQPAQMQIDEDHIDGSERAFLEAAGIWSTLILPLVFSGQPFGLIEVMDRRPGREFNPREITLGLLLVNNAAVAIEKTRLFQEVRQRSAELEAVLKASLSLTASLDLNEVLDTILENTLSLLEGAQDAHVFLYGEDSLCFAAALWADGRKGQPWSNPRPDGLTYRVARSGEVILVNDMRTHLLFVGTPPSWQGSIVGLPLKIGPRVVGVMTVAHSQAGAFEEADLRAIRLLGDQAAIAIENARLHKLVAHQARTDALTNLPNRRALDERLEEEILRASRYQHSFSVLMVDLNNFKLVNDTYGHPTGDEVLKKIALCLRQSVREIDFVSRYGGDEFVILLPETNLDTASQLAQRLTQAISECPLDLPDGAPFEISLGCGLAVFPVDGIHPSELLLAADQALYRSKIS